MLSRLTAFFLFITMFNAATYCSGNNSGRLDLKKNWLIQSSAKVKEDGNQISTVGFNTAGWYKAEVPSTVLGDLVKDKIYTGIFFGKNLEKVPVERFKVPWWYRTEFTIPWDEGMNTYKLEFNGINYRANIWLNGKKIASADTTFGSFRRFEINVSGLAKPGQKNILAVEVTPPAKGEPTMGFVDWSPQAPDHNMGLWRGVSLKICGDVSVNFPFVKTRVDTASLKKAWLTISSEVQNNSGKEVSGELICSIGRIKISKKVSLAPNEIKLVTFKPDDYASLVINNPRLWWTYDFGRPELYSMNIGFKINNRISDERHIEFGIREVSDYFTKQGFRGYKLNGKKILIRGGGWADNMLLDNSYDNLVYQIDYAKQMNLNTIRMEGFWGESQDIFNLCDKKGILIMVGWSAQWEWEDVLGKPADDYGGIKSAEDMKTISESFDDQIKWLRNHPSIFLWLYGSDKIPRPELEEKYMAILKADDPTRPYLASAHEHTSTITGKTAVKMRGPYDYVPPDYWFIDKKDGGAFGFNTETGPGPQVPPVESLRKMIPEDSLWPINGEWYYHCSRGNFSKLERYNEAISERLGAPGSLADYERKAQLTNYDGMRAMYEAFDANKFVSTGVIQWMYNSAWPKQWWQLYDYYLMPNGAFYGARKAGEPVHIQYYYGKNSVYAVNNSLRQYKNLTARISVFNFDMKKKYSNAVKLNLMPNESKQIAALPEVKDLSETYFINLGLFKDGKEVSNNFYCLSKTPDVLDTAKATWFVTPEKQYADLKELNKLPEVDLQVKHQFEKRNDGREYVAIELNNPTGNLAFSVELMVTAGREDNPVLPVFLDDNYFSILPHHKKIIKGYFYTGKLDGKNPYIKISGWNVKTKIE